MIAFRQLLLEQHMVSMVCRNISWSKQYSVEQQCIQHAIREHAFAEYFRN